MLQSFIRFFAALALLAGVLSTAVAGSSHDLAKRWDYLATAQGNEPVTFRLRLAGQHFDELGPKMHHIATTRSSWLTSDELRHYVIPSHEHQTAVQEFLDKHGVAHDQLHVNRFRNVWTIESDAGSVSKVSTTSSSF